MVKMYFFHFNKFINQKSRIEKLEICLIIQCRMRNPNHANFVSFTNRHVKNWKKKFKLKISLHLISSLVIDYSPQKYNILSYNFFGQMRKRKSIFFMTRKLFFPFFISFICLIEDKKKLFSYKFKVITSHISKFDFLSGSGKISCIKLS